MTVIHTKYLDAEVNFPGDGEMEVERVLTKSGEDITNIINDLSAWGYKSRAEFVEKAHAKEKEERAADKKAGRASK